MIGPTGVGKKQKLPDGLAKLANAPFV